MTPYEFTPQASADLLEIWFYIASDNFENADRVESAIYEACVLIAREPKLGQMRADLTALPLRFWTIQRYPNYILRSGSVTTTDHPDSARNARRETHSLGPLTRSRRAR